MDALHLPRRCGFLYRGFLSLSPLSVANRLRIAVDRPLHPSRRSQTAGHSQSIACHRGTSRSLLRRRTLFPTLPACPIADRVSNLWRGFSKGGSMNRFQCFASLLAILLAVSGAAFSQAASSLLQGTVTDPSGAPSRARVTLANVDSKTERTAVTGTQGEYRIRALPSGTYTLTGGRFHWKSIRSDPDHRNPAGGLQCSPSSEPASRSCLDGKPSLHLSLDGILLQSKL